ncbi:MAG: cytochrome P450, partial [Gemmatimonadetes bacterium]|nr:cytochrome P450 [Gemmatimonadota bacterium]
GELWRRQRRLIQPYFHPDRIARYAETMVRETETLMDEWHPFVRDGRTVDLRSEMMRLTFRIVGKALLGADVTGETDAVRGAVDVLQRQTNERLFSLISLPLWFPTPDNREFRLALRTLDDIVYRLIATGRADRSVSRGVLGALVAAAESNEGLPDRQIRDEIVTLLLAGHENTGNALTWLWYLIARHPQVERRLCAELCEVLGGRAPAWNDLSKLTYTRMVVEESLRLYPTSWLNLRTAREDDSIDGFRIAAGSWILISPYLTHRHPAFWPEPKRFDPERFIPEEKQRRHRFAYVPFGGGPRKCLGNHFASSEMALIVATIARRLRFRPAFSGEVEPQPLVSLPPRGGMPVTIHDISEDVDGRQSPDIL